MHERTTKVIKKFHKYLRLMARPPRSVAYVHIRRLQFPPSLAISFIILVTFLPMISFNHTSIRPSNDSHYDILHAIQWFLSLLST